MRIYEVNKPITISLVCTYVYCEQGFDNSQVMSRINSHMEALRFEADEVCSWVDSEVTNL